MDFYKRKSKPKTAKPVDTLKKEVGALQEQSEEAMRMNKDKDEVAKVSERIDEKIAEYENMRENAEFVEKQKLSGLIKDLKQLREKVRLDILKKRPPMASPRISKTEKKEPLLLPGVEVNELQQNLMRMRQKRLNRVSKFVDEEHLSSAQENDGMMEDAIKSMNESTPMTVPPPRPKRLIRDKAGGRSLESMESIDESSGTDEEIVKDSIREKRYRQPRFGAEVPFVKNIASRRSLESILEKPKVTQSSPTFPRAAKSLESPRTPTPSVKKLFSTFGACTTNASSDEEDNSYSKNVPKPKPALQIAGAPKNEDLLPKKSIVDRNNTGNKDFGPGNVRTDSKEIETKLNYAKLDFPKFEKEPIKEKSDNIFDEQKYAQKTSRHNLPSNNSFKLEEKVFKEKQEENSNNNNNNKPTHEDLSIENPIYGYVKSPGQHLITVLMNNRDSIAKIMSDNIEIEYDTVNTLMPIIEQTQNFLSDIQAKIDKKIKKKQDTFLDEFTGTYHVISKDVNDFRGLKRDMSYIVLTNKLNKLYSDVSKLVCEDRLCEAKKEVFLDNVNGTVRALEDKVTKNELLLHKILEEQVELLTLTTLYGTEV